MKAYQFVTSVAIAKTLQIKVSKCAILLHWHVMKNGAIQVTYCVKGKNCSTFLSQKSIALGAVAVMAERANDLTLKAKWGQPVGHNVLNESGKVKYVCDFARCTCPSYDMNQLDQILGFKVCKHTIKSAKLDRVAFSLNQLSSLILGK